MPIFIFIVMHQHPFIDVIKALQVMIDYYCIINIVTTPQGKRESDQPLLPL